MKVTVGLQLSKGSILRDTSVPDRYLLVMVAGESIDSVYSLLDLETYTTVSNAPFLSELADICIKKGYILIGHANNFNLEGRR